MSVGCDKFRQAKRRCIFAKIRRDGWHPREDVRHMTNLLSSPVLEDIDNLPPAPEEVMLVQCEKFRCLAFRDRQGKWRSPFSKMELPRVVHVIEPSPY
jgi:hypothetical protein